MFFSPVTITEILTSVTSCRAQAAFKQIGQISVLLMCCVASKLVLSLAIFKKNMSCSGETEIGKEMRTVAVYQMFCDLHCVLRL